MSSEDLVAQWNISLPDGKYLIEFEHGTTSGRRVIIVNKKEVFRENWMFKLVGKEYFEIGKHKCIITIDSKSGFTYEYLLEVDGKPYEKFRENQSKILQSWTFSLSGVHYRCVLEKHTMDLWLNGQRVECEPEFTDDGTETNFEMAGHHIRLVTVSSGHRRSGLIHALFVDDKEIPAAIE
jgi:hypothetical protein